MIGKKINQLATELAPVSTDLTIIGDPTTGVSKKITLAQLGAIFSGAVSFYTDLASFPATGDINVIYCAKDTQKLYLWSGSAYTEVFPSQALLDTYQLRSEKGNANGYASLDSQGKVPISQLPSSIMEYKGTWNASTNTPTLANGTGDTGDVYICNVAGTVNFGAGPLTFAVGDYVIYSGTIWQRSSGAVGTVTSVAATITGDSVTISGSPVTTSGTLAFAFAGTGAQYIKGDGTLATFPTTIDQAKNLITEVYNSTGATLTKGTVVYINGGQGNLPTVTKALASGDSTSAQTYGIVQADITNNNNGFVVVAGRLTDIDTQAYANGTQLYLSSTTAGAYTSTKQYAPAHLVYVGIIVRSHPTQGIIEVKIQNGYELDELHDVAAQNPDNNDIIQYKTSTGLWTKVAGSTSNIAEGSNLYYTDARSRAAISETVTGLDYNNTTGVLSLTSGYVIPTTTNETNWNAAYNDKINSAAVTGTTTKTLTLTQQDGGTITASWTDDNTDAVTSVFGRTGAVVAASGDYTTAQVTESGNLYFTNARAIASTLTGYTSGAGTISSSDSILSAIQKLNGNIGALTTGVSSVNGLTGAVTLTTSNIAEGTNLYYTEARVSANTNVAANTAARHNAVTLGTANGLSLSTQVLSLALASGSTTGALSSTDWTTFNNKQSALTNPVTGTGTTNYLPKFTGTSTIGNSLVYDNGSVVSIGTNGTLVQTLNINSTYASQSLNSTSGNFAYIGLNNGATGGAFNFAVEGSTGGTFGTGSTAYAGVLSRLGAYNLQFATNNVVRATLDASGNLGLGVTPSAWISGYNAIQIGNGANFTGYLFNRWDEQEFGLVANGYRSTSGSWLYYKTGFSTRYVQNDGAHIWSNAPSGTAGNAISFTQAMTLHASGNLSIGNTNDTYKLDVSGTSIFRGTLTISGPSAIKWNYSDNFGYFGIGYISGADYGFYNYNYGRTDLIFTQNTGAATFSGGNVLVTNVATSGYAFTSVASSWGSTSQIYTAIKIGAAGDNLTGTGVDLRAYTQYGTGSGTEFRLFTNSTSNVLTEALRIASNQAATFSSRVNVNNAPDDADIAMTIKAPSGAGKFILFGRDASNVAVFRVSSAGAATFSDTIKTGDPGLGSAGAIKLGQRFSGTAIIPSGYIPIDIDGTTYYINLFEQTP